MHIREMELADLENVVTIEKELFTSAWSYDDFIYEILENEFAHNFILEKDNIMIGYVCLWIMYEQSQITTIGVDRFYQGQGYGKLLMNSMIEYAKKHGCTSMTLEVRVSNEVAIGLYESCGFEKKAIRKNYYQDNHEDAYLMLKELEVCA